MNNTPKEIIQAWFDGKTIQVRVNKNSPWLDVQSYKDEFNPVLDFCSWQYRIKSEEPKKVYIRYYIHLSDPKRTEFPMISNTKDDYKLNCIEPGNNDNYQWITPIIEFYEFMGNQL